MKTAMIKNSDLSNIGKFCTKLHLLEKISLYRTMLHLIWRYFIIDFQFSVGISTRSITMVSRGPFPSFSNNPSCSRTAVRIDGPVAEFVLSGAAVVLGVQLREKL